MFGSNRLSLWCLQKQDVLAELTPGPIHDAFVHRDQNHSIAYGQARQAGTLFGAKQALEERVAQRVPVLGDGQITIAGMLREIFQNGRGLGHLDLPGALRGRIAQESGFGEGGQAATKAWSHAGVSKGRS